jgi:peptidoglycan/xylan/chitin deacetylase (PgdA/CDA1 family)
MAMEVALTFDDGPHPDGTRRILELLQEHGVKATFFVWGERASQHREVVQDVLASGHLVQPHCWAHNSHWSLDPDGVRADIEKVMALLGDLEAPTPHLWRPPYGQLLRVATRAIAAEHGLELAGWTINPKDFEGTDATTMYHDLAGQFADADSRPVVLMHDGHREPGQLARRTDTSNTCGLVRLLLGDGALRFALLSGGVEASLWEGPSRSDPVTV